MSYVLRADIASRIPPAFIVEALDDDSDGIEDTGLWDQICATIDSEIDGFLSRRYTLPLSDPPASLRSGASSLMCEALYQRRGIASDSNPHTAAAGRFRAWLQDIATGKSALQVSQSPARAPISIISEPAGTVPRRRLNG